MLPGVSSVICREAVGSGVSYLKKVTAPDSWVPLLFLPMRFIICYATSMALVSFFFGSVFGMVMVRMPSSTFAEILSFTTSSGSV